MHKPLSLLARVAPTLLMVTSLMLLGVGLLSFSPSTFVADQTPEPVAGDPRLPTATPGPTATPVPLNPASARPLPTPHDGIVASRIRIPAVGIDLPIVAGDLDYPGNVDFYPLCDVAMYLPEFVQPGEQGATYLYAHAQRGMFAPLLNASEVRDGEGLVGALIEVYTSDNKLHLYELYRVKRHATDLSLTEVPPGAHLLVLQTSEGPPGTVPKLQVAARPISVVEATETDANPEANPRVCLPD